MALQVTTAAPCCAASASPCAPGSCPAPTVVSHLYHHIFLPSSICAKAWSERPLLNPLHFFTQFDSHLLLSPIASPVCTASDIVPWIQPANVELSCVPPSSSSYSVPGSAQPLSCPSAASLPALEQFQPPITPRSCLTTRFASPGERTLRQHKDNYVPHQPTSCLVP